MHKKIPRLIGFLCAITLVITSCAGGAKESAPQLSQPVATTLRPTPDGFSFPNFPASATQVVFGDADLLAMFGADACVDGVATPCVATAEAAAWARMVNQARLSGHCEGLVVDAADRFDLRLSPPTFELKNDPILTSTIIRKFATQFFPEVQKERDEWAKRSLREIVNALGKAFLTGTTPYVLGVYSSKGGHAILPYAVEFESADVAIVRVYDSNWPGKNRFVRMNLATDEWTFSFSGPDPATDPKPWSGKSGDVDLGSNQTRDSSKCPFCVTGGKSLGSFVVIRAGNDDWSVTANGVDYTEQNATKAGVVQVRPVINGYSVLDKFATDVRDFVVIMHDNQNFTVNLKSVGSAFIVQPSFIGQVTNTGSKPVAVSIADQAIATTGGDTTVTVAAANVVVSASGGSSAVTINEGQITATISTDSGQTATVTASAATPQALVQVAQGDTGPAIVVTTRNRSDEVQVTEISSNGSTAMRPSTDVLDLNSTQLVLPAQLQVATVKDQLPPAIERDTANPNYKVDIQFVASTAEVVQRNEVLAAALPITSEPSTSLPEPVTTESTTTTTTTTTSSTTTTTAAPQSRTIAIDGDSYSSSYSSSATPPTLTSAASAGSGTKTYSSSATSVCTVGASSGVVDFVGAGTCVLRVAIASSGLYDAATSSSISFTVSDTRTIAINSGSYSSSYSSSATPPTLTSTASAGSGTKTYSSSATSVCTVGASSGVVDFVGAGTCVLRVAIASSGLYDAATSSSISFTVSDTRTIAINGASYSSTYSRSATPPTLTSTASAGSGTKTYSSSSTSVCTVGSSSGVVAFVTAGTCVLRVAIASSGLYDAATSSSISFTVLTTRTISVNSGSYAFSYISSATPPTLTSTASAGSGTKTYSSTTTGVCTIGASSGVVDFITAGTCVLRVTIASSGSYDAATSSSISFTVSNSRTISINSSSYTSSYISSDTPPTLTSTTSAGTGTKTYSSSTTSVCTVGASSGVVDFVTAGTCMLRVTIASSGSYDAATSSSISFVVSDTRTIAINGASYSSTYSRSATPPTLTSTASAGSGTKTYSSATTSVCSVNSLTGVVAFVTAGTCMLRVAISSSGSYDAATSSTISFMVLTARTISINSSSYTSLYISSDTPPTLTSTASAGAGTKTYSSTTTGVCTIGASSGVVAFITAGTCTLRVAIASSGSYDAATSSSISFAVLITRTISIDSGSYTSSYSSSATPPALTSTATAGTGTKTYSSTTTGVCTIGASSGVVDFVAAGTCSLQVAIASSGSYDAATSSSISFTVSDTRTISINSSSYTSSYISSDTPPTLTSTASAGTGTKTYSSATTGVCTVNASTGVVAFVAAGTCSLQVAIASSGSYDAATSSSISFTVLTARTISIDSGSYTSSYISSATPPTLTSSATAGTGTKTYSSTTTGVCTVNSSTGVVAFVTAGTCLLRVAIASSGSYDAATSSSISITVLTARTISINSSSYTSSYSSSATPPTLTSTVSLGAGTKTYSSTTTGVCAVNGSSGLVAFVAAGTCTLQVAITSDGTYDAVSSSTISFTVLTARTISINSSSYTSSYHSSATPPTLTSTATAGTGTKTYSSTTTGVCTVNSSTGVVAFAAAGTCTLRVTIASSGSYDAATSSTISFTVSDARTISINSSSYTSSYNSSATPPTLTSTATAGSGTKTYTSTTTGVCTVNALSGLVVFVTPGTCTLQVAITSDGTYDAVSSASISFTVLTTRTISIDGGSYTSSYNSSATPPTLTSTATAGSGTKTYTSTTTGVCTVNGSSGLVAFVAPGTCTLQVAITSDGTYDAVSSSSISFTVLTTRTITINSGSYTSSYNSSATPPTLTSTASAGTGTKTYSSTTTGVCTVNGASGLVAFVAPGTCTLQVAIASDGTYDAVSSSTISFTVLTIRTITINSGSYTSSYNSSATPPTLTSTATAGTGTKTYSSTTTGVCTVNGASGLVAFVAAGTCTLQVAIASDGTYDAVSSSSISFAVLTTRTISIDGGSYTSSYSSSATPPTLTSTASAGTGTKTYSSTTAGVCTVNGASGLVAFVAAGTCTLQVAIASDGTYDAVSSSSISFTVLTTRTISIDSGSYTSSYSLSATPPTLTSTASAGSGTKTYSSSTTPVCTVNASSGLVAFVAAGPCTLQVAIASDGTYGTATSSTISFTVVTTRTITIDSSSYTSTYNRYATAPTLTSTASAGSGTKTYSSSTTSVCTVNTSSGLVAFVTAGTCTLQVAIASDGSYGTATSSSVSLSVTYAIGDTGPGGGKIFMTLSTVGNSTGKYFESALGTWNSGSDKNNRWCNLTTLAIGPSAQGTAIGTGQGNTTAIVAACTSGAAVDARAYAGGGLSDWFLPSKVELEQMFANRIAIGGFTTLTQLFGGTGPTNSYWSSSEDTTNSTIHAIPVNFTNGGGDNYGKIYGFNVRPIRMFAPIG